MKKLILIILTACSINAHAFQSDYEDVMNGTEEEQIRFGKERELDAQIKIEELQEELAE